MPSPAKGLGECVFSPAGLLMTSRCSSSKTIKSCSPACAFMNASLSFRGGNVFEQISHVLHLHTCLKPLRHERLILVADAFDVGKRHNFLFAECLADRHAVCVLISDQADDAIAVF